MMNDAMRFIIFILQKPCFMSVFPADRKFLNIMNKASMCYKKEEVNY